MTPEEKKLMAEATKDLNKEVSELKDVIKTMTTDAKKAADEIDKLNNVIESKNINIGVLSDNIDKGKSIINDQLVQITELSENLKAAKVKAEDVSRLEAQVQRITQERNQAVDAIAELSSQVADQSKVKTEKEILVKVDGKRYLLERRTMHTLAGEVSPEDAAKDEDFLRELISKGGGNIRPAK